MNREILFRGKRLDNGEWVYGYYCKHIKRQVCPVGDELKPEDIAHLIINDGFADWNMPRSLQGYDVDPETVGQYTGLKDKSHNRIYKGDILKGHYYSNGFKKRIVGMVDFGLNGWYVFGVKQYEWSSARLTSSFEVIGNAQDNPELLEVEYGKM